MNCCHGIHETDLSYIESHTGIHLAEAFAGMLEQFRISEKILSVTCDNASNNDKMVTEMPKSLTCFSPVKCTQCIAHILKLVTKSLLKQFDTKPDENDQGDLNDRERGLLALAGNIEQEELTTTQEYDQDDDGEIKEGDDVEGWVDEVHVLSPQEQENLEESLLPVKWMLIKV